MLLRLYFMDMHELRFKLHAVSQAVLSTLDVPHGLLGCLFASAPTA